MFTDRPPRAAEHLHSKKCMASALIAAVENVRDTEDETDHEFRLSAQDNYFLVVADEYLTTGTITCLCPECKLPCCEGLD